MNFNEFHNAEYWEEQRKEKEGQVTLPQLVCIITAGAMFFFFTYLFAIAGV